MDDITNGLKKIDSITSAEIFGSEIIPELLEQGPTSFSNSFKESKELLPFNSVFFSNTLVCICPGCDCVDNPELIKPYLERQTVLPILTTSLSEYRTDFLKTVIKHPYISSYSHRLFRYVYSIHKKNENSSTVVNNCGGCHNKIAKRILDKLSKIEGSTERSKFAKQKLKETVFGCLFPTYLPEAQLIQEIENSIDHKNIENIFYLGRKAFVLDDLRNAQLFDSMPQVAQEDLINIDNSLKEFNFSTLSINSSYIEEEIMKALNLDYNPKMPIEEYLEIVLPRKEKITSLVDQLITSKEKEKEISRINDEVWKINDEISSSKSIETLTFFTDFITDNAQIIFGILIGGLIGYSSASFAGCGFGSTIGGVATGVAKKIVSKGLFNVPSYPRKTKEWLASKIENPEERLLSAILAKDIKTIQVWALRKKLEKKA